MRWWLLLCVASATAVAAPADPAAVATVGRSLREQGRYAEAREKLLGARSLEARYQLGLVYHATGERSLERAVWNSFYDDYEQGRIDKKSARELTYVARAAQLLGGWKDANDTYRDAVDADPKGKDGARANIAWARLFLEKYDAGHAEACLNEALTILPEDPEGRTLLAAVKLEQSYDVPAAERELDRADKAKRGYPEAVALRGKIALEIGELDRARAAAERLLKSNPHDLAAHTLLAGAALMNDDRPGYDAERDRVLATNAHAGRFFHDLGELLVREHRYTDAVSLEEESLRVDDKDPVARAAYGANLLRLGREDEGLAALRQAWRGDKYNVRTYNLLQLFEEVIPKRYVTIEAPPFRLRVPTSERVVLEATVVPLLQRARTALDALYETKLKGPITVELYTDPKHYAVRTIGLPGLDAVGVTFGPVITAMSPSVGKFNWGMVLWHELSHVYAIEASHSRVPRWFTEGLSEYETTQADPTWTRRTSAELAGAIQRDELLPTRDLDRAFTLARDLPHMVVAYHEAAAAVRYFVERAGRPGVRKALALFADGKRTPEVLTAILGEGFDRSLREALKTRLAGYEGQLLIRPSDYSDVEGLSARLEAQPKDGRARGLLALARLGQGDAEGAQKLLAYTGAPPSPEVMYASARVFLTTKHLDEAKLAIETLRGAGGRGCDVELLAARVHKARGDIESAWRALEDAARADPDRAEPYLLQAELAQGTPRPTSCAKDNSACTIRALSSALPLDVMDASIGRRLWKLRAGQPEGNAAAQRALEVAPFDGELRLELAERAAEKPAGRSEAKRELSLAQACPLSDAAKARAAQLATRLSTSPAPR